MGARKKDGPKRERKCEPFIPFAYRSRAHSYILAVLARSLTLTQITRHGPLDALYSQLPYVLVSEWTEITAAALVHWRRDIVQRFGAEPFAHPNVTRLLNASYWAKLIKERRSTIPDTVANPTSIWKQCDA